MFKIFIDGQAGTTGLQIVERLKGRDDISLLEIPHEERKNQEVKREYLNNADLVVLCLPDAAAIEAVSMVENDSVKILDASTAHRINPDWAYGLPELNAGQRQKIRDSKRVANPGCYPTGFLLAVAPLIEAGLIPADYPITINAISGYSGGGRQLIEKYKEHEQVDTDKVWSHRPYALLGGHKHLPEMKRYAGMKNLPVFAPAVSYFEQGMLVNIPLVPSALPKGVNAESIQTLWNERYEGESFISVQPINDTDSPDAGFLPATTCNGTNRVDLFVYANEDQIILTARLDNLGKGASGAAIQNMNLMLGVDETKGL